MSCVRPPLLKKPSRGFAWACGPCSRAQERKLEARNTPLIDGAALGADEDEIMEDDDEDGIDRGAKAGEAAGGEVSGLTVDAATPEQSAHAKLWPYRYLGQHCRVEDALDYDDRIYPRASSRLGPRHQAMVGPWPGRPIQLVKPAEIKRKYARGAVNKKDAKLSKDTLAALEAEKLAKEKRPKWVQDEPPGYVARGEDYEPDDPRCTATLMFKMPEMDETADRGGVKRAAKERLVDDYVDKIENLAEDLGVDPSSTNLLDKSVEILYRNNFDAQQSIKAVRALDKEKDLKEPNFTKDEQRLFEEGVAKYGSELHSVARHVKSQKHANIVRYYYVWKKTPRGKQIWGQYEGRKGKKEVKEVKKVDGSKLLDDFADDGDDSAFDESKAARRKRSFECKFCGCRSSQQWRRAPGAAPGATFHGDGGSTRANGKDKGSQTLVALCRRCGELWRRYGVQWEDLDEVAKKVAQGGGKAWKRKIDEELLRELVSDSYPPANAATNSTAVNSGSVAAVPPASSVTPQPTPEPPRKKLKPLPQEKESSKATTRISPGTTTTRADQPVERPKKKAAEKIAAPPPPPPEPPKPKILPCAVCNLLEPIGEQHLVCRECRMTVHRNCYGVLDEQWSTNKWICDMCANDKNPQVATVSIFE